MVHLFSKLAEFVGKLKAADVRLMATWFDELKEALIRFGSLISIAAMIVFIILCAVAEFHELVKLLGL